MGKMEENDRTDESHNNGDQDESSVRTEKEPASQQQSGEAPPEESKREHRKHKKKKKKHRHKDRTKEEDINGNDALTEHSIKTDSHGESNETLTADTDHAIVPLSQDTEKHSNAPVNHIKHSSSDDELTEEEKRGLIQTRKNYQEEKLALEKQLEDARTKSEEEIKKFEQELATKRQEYENGMSELEQNDQRRTSWTQRMEDVSELEQGLERRLQQCAEHQEEVEDAERFLDRRQQLCNSREADLRKCDEELDTLHQELELDKERLERAGFDTSNIGNRKERSRSFNTSTGDNDDYIIKANLRKCQANLKTTEETLASRNEDIATLKDQVQTLQSEKKKQQDKIKHLETQLSVALSQISHSKTMHQSSSSKDPGQQDRYRSTRSHVSLDRMNSANLSINQQAQLRRNQSLRAGNNSTGSRRSSQYTSLETKSGPPSVMGKSDEGMGESPGTSEGSPGASTAALLNGTQSSFESTDSNSRRNVSTTCAVM